MKKLARIINTIRVAELADLGIDIKSTLDTTGIEDENLKTISKQIEVQQVTLITAINQDKAKSDLNTFDDNRDSIYSSILRLTEGYTHHPDAQISQTATQVLEIMNKYGYELTKANYSAQSALTESFLKDVLQPETVIKTELLPGVKNLIQKLKNEQKQFKQAENTWEQNQKENQNAISASAVKKELIRIINSTLINYLIGMGGVQPEVYNDLIESMALKIDRINGVIKQRKQDN